jgi:uncharacterized protein
VLAGHSFGGLFSLYALLQRPALFQGVIAASPTFAWDNQLLERLTTTSPPKGPGSLFFTMANEDRPMMEGFERYKKLLAAKAGKELAWSARYHEDEDHGSVVFETWYHGLRHVFSGWHLPLNPASPPGLTAVTAHYAQLSKRFGFEVAIPEQSLNMLGYAALGAKDHDQAIAVFLRNAELNPASANVHDSLGEAYETKGELELARQSYARAYAAGKKRKDPNTAIFKTNLDRVSKKQR